jgi:hypothetical protein
MGRPAHAAAREGNDHPAMEDRGILHRIEDDLELSWVDQWAAQGIDEIEAYLAKHLAFLAFLDES